MSLRALCLPAGNSRGIQPVAEAWNLSLNDQRLVGVLRTCDYTANNELMARLVSKKIA